MPRSSCSSPRTSTSSSMLVRLIGWEQLQTRIWYGTLLISSFNWALSIDFHLQKDRLMQCCLERRESDMALALWSTQKSWKSWRKRKSELKLIQFRIKFWSWSTTYETIPLQFYSPMITLSWFQGSMHILLSACSASFNFFLFQWRPVVLGRAAS